MSYQVLGVALIAVVYFVVRLVSATDTAKIKGIPEIPGVPIFGNLLQLGVDHARVAQKWAAQYGPVFQTRLGTKVITAPCGIEDSGLFRLTLVAARHLCQLIRVCEAFLDHSPVRSHLAPYLSHFSLRRFNLPRLYHWHISMG